MKVLLDTNIVIHREASTVVNEDIGVLFKWLDDLHCAKCVHSATAGELSGHADPRVAKTMAIKLQNYRLLESSPPLSSPVAAMSAEMDVTPNDHNDTAILDAVYSDRVDALITEDRRIHEKAARLGVSARVFTIDAFLEKAVAENPGLADYGVLAVRKELFGSIDVGDAFFDSLREAYHGFDQWFGRKADETAYVCRAGETLSAFLYLKSEGRDEAYSDIKPGFVPARRLKIGTLKVDLNGYKLGERFLKIAFDNALRLGVDELYVTTFGKGAAEERLVGLLEDFGFAFHGHKGDDELVYVRDFRPRANAVRPSVTFPYFARNARAFVTPIYPEYHTELFPDSILRTESPADFVENEPHRNAIRKAYISRSIERRLQSGDVVFFYRTGGYHKSVISTIGIVERVRDGIRDEAEFVRLCRHRSVFSDAELGEHWNFKPHRRPFIVDFLYAYSLPKRINLRRLIELGVIRDIESAPRGFTRITATDVENIMRECCAHESIAVD